MTFLNTSLIQRYILFLVAATLSIPASAENWVESGSIPNQGIYTYVDTESISKQGNYKQAFTKAIEISKERFTIALRTYDCRSNPKRLKNTYVASYNLEGDIILSGTPTDVGFSPVIPGSLGVETADIICKY